MRRVHVPVIGIGAGPATDGQVLVFHDLLGIGQGHVAKFVKRYAEIERDMVEGLGAYVAEVRDRQFPQPEHSYTIDSEELDAVRGYLENSAAATSAWDW
jgi:3-methyl-2-oxobutanoate hydroxymethyltransferase